MTRTQVEQNILSLIIMNQKKRAEKTNITIQVWRFGKPFIRQNNKWNKMTLRWPKTTELNWYKLEYNNI